MHTFFNDNTNMLYYCYLQKLILVFNRCTTALGLDSVDMTQLTSVEDWLASLKMSRYVDNFQRTGLTDLEAVARLTQHDLTQLGITLVGHQKKILQSIHTLRTQLAVNMSEGFLV